MKLPPLTYLSIDSVSEGIGLSQVVRYVERLGQRGVDVTLHSFERGVPDPVVAERMETAGVRWRPHRFRGSGAAGGLLRVGHGAVLLAGAELVHARSDLAAASALLSRRPRWIWDFRGFWREQRIAQGLMRPDSLPERAMKAVEAAAARSCAGIVTLTRAATDVLRERYGDAVGAKAAVIPTCVDLDLFAFAAFPETARVGFLLAGTLNRLYDVPAMLRLIDHVSKRCAADLTILTSEPTPWEEEFAARGLAPKRARPDEMPAWIQSHHVGLSVLRDVGLSNRGATPTKLGEFLACGRPVVVNAGLGDMDDLLPAYDCGVVLGGTSERELDVAAEEILRLVADPGTAARCRALATENFDLERGVAELLAVYARALA